MVSGIGGVSNGMYTPAYAAMESIKADVLLSAAATQEQGDEKKKKLNPALALLLVSMLLENSSFNSTSSAKACIAATAAQAGKDHAWFQNELSKLGQQFAANPGGEGLAGQVQSMLQALAPAQPACSALNQQLNEVAVMSSAVSFGAAGQGAAGVTAYGQAAGISVGGMAMAGGAISVSA
ncbi:hypothetical protein [Chromobacterium amazonense]|uniref:Uncharacterized protein n=1 Tax=Chromobacterium amazonense TaxID=1382803 RepID=A0ABU8V1W0_9NEIS|nr:hypothetical protein [Chromobacterium amazonense]MDQ4540697.1 hypothetical protein [Chromobacterium amazonense]